MTIYERVKEALERDFCTDLNNFEEPCSREMALDTLIRFAYEYGKYDGVHAVSDAANKRYNAQREEARKCRYYKMVLDIVENAGQEGMFGYRDIFSYHPDYAGDYLGSFGGEQWPGDDFEGR